MLGTIHVNSLVDFAVNYLNGHHLRGAAQNGNCRNNTNRRPHFKARSLFAAAGPADSRGSDWDQLAPVDLHVGVGRFDLRWSQVAHVC